MNNKENGHDFDWAKQPMTDVPPSGRPGRPLKVELDDETLRDGLQGTQIELHPTTEEKRIYLEWASRFVEHADIGFPASGEEHQKEIADLIRYSVARGFDITLSCAARAASQEDVRPIIDISHELDGYPLEADIFLDGSHHRSTKEGWDRDEKLAQFKENIRLLKSQKLPVMFVAERATSTPPEELFEILQIASDLGVERIGLADTQGKASPAAVSNMFRWAFAQFKEKYPEMLWDFHGHNDLGFGSVNCLVSAQEGVDRVHVTSFGIGERVGNADLATTTLVLNLNGFRGDDLSELQEFSKRASEILHFTIPRNAPVIGESAFATSSGVHSASLDKSQNNGSDIYFAYDPAVVGREPKVEVGLFSGAATVRYRLRKLGIAPSDPMIQDILDAGKSGRGFLSDNTIKSIAQRHLTDSKK